MSRFLTPKYMQYRELVERGRIESDRACESCGYNLRGLEFGRKCPECGHAQALGTSSHPLTDIILSGNEASRVHWRRGLGLAVLALLGAVVARGGYFFLAARGPTPLLQNGYIWFGAVNSVVWIVAVWMITPRSIGQKWAWLNGPRVAARVLALMWLPGYACLLARYALPASFGGMPALALGDAGGRFFGGIGVMCTAFVLHHIAAEAELPDAARRLSSAMWLLWIPTLLAQAFGVFVPWFVLVLLGLVLGCWAWLMTLMILGVHELYCHVRWSGIHAIEAQGRDDRIKEKRVAIEAEVESTVRPLPPDSGDDLSY
jgi:hypothetical protein